MQGLSEEGRRIIEDVARRHGFSTDAATAMLLAVAAGNGFQAQFNHPEFGGMGQWSQGGMIMIGDMFNNNLKYRVDGLANELSNVLRSSNLYAPVPVMSSQSQSQSGGAAGVSLFVPGAMSSGNWWPAELGIPASTGSQNSLRYAYFPATRRLALQQDGRVTTYDTGNHQISGFSQQQSGDQSLTFTSQFGLVRLYDLPMINTNPPASPVAPVVPPSQSPASPSVEAAPFNAPANPQAPVAVPHIAGGAKPGVESSEDIFAKIERLAELRQKGIITDQEFEAKKSELLSRI